MLLSVASPNQARTSCPDNRPAELGSLMDSPRQPRPLLAPQWTSQAEASFPVGTGCLSSSLLALPSDR